MTSPSTTLVQQILDDLWGELAEQKTGEAETISAIVKLFDKGKLTSTNLSNALSELREVVTNDKN